MKHIKVKITPHKIINDCLDSAAERACNRCDKYSEIALTDNQRIQLIKEFNQSFWLALDDCGAEIV